MMGRTSITYITRYVSKKRVQVSYLSFPSPLSCNEVSAFSRDFTRLSSVLFAESLRHMTSARRPFYSQRYESHRRVSRYHEFAGLILIVSEATTRSTGGTCRR